MEPAGCKVGWAEPGTCLLYLLCSRQHSRGWRGARGHPSLLPPAPPRRCWVLSSQHGLVAPWHRDHHPVSLAEPVGISGSLFGEARSVQGSVLCASKESLGVKRGELRLRAQLVTYGTRPLP